MIVINIEAIAWLTVHALNEISRANEDEGCCPECCGPCHAISLLDQDGALDAIVGPAADGYDWWDAEAGQVDRDLLNRAWRMTECHIEPRG